MTDTRYCEPCQRLICGRAKFQDREDPICFDHHPDAKSLEDSLRMPCDICSLAWGSYFEGGTIPGGTSGRLLHSTGEYNEKPDENILQFRCEWPTILSRTIAVVPRERMQRYQFPPNLSDRIDSPPALEFLLRKYQECNETHIACTRHQPSVVSQPLRLVHVGRSNSSHTNICNTQDLVEKGPYVCLSYCWGRTQPVILTKETEKLLRIGIPLSALAKTIQDAIFVTRKLGIRYLLVDALCIFQDNQSVWAAEASHMGDIYSGAACTIAATSASDSNGGLLFDGDRDMARPLCVEITLDHNSDTEEADTITYPPAGIYWCDIRELQKEAIEKAPLNSRAWVCQERHLSRRVLHFTKSQPFWECYDHSASEIYHDYLPKWAFSWTGDDPTMLKKYIRMLELQEIGQSLTEAWNGRSNPLFVRQDATNKYLYDAWLQFRIHYSVCQMTREGDKLLAIKGIEQDLSRILISPSLV